MVRQGDVLLVKVDELPKGTSVVPRDNGRLVLAYGEATGHAHVVDAPPAEATLLTTEQNERFLRIVGSGATLTHEEHGAIAIAPGSYRVVIGREWTDEMAARP
ncbi:MAG: hypothetical protein L0227_17805, partial [Chloroflexi bacterium]|nr:hypothetical protein [Chloroflexota bacterium]